jgi:hypothetical protein
MMRVARTVHLRIVMRLSVTNTILCVLLGAVSTVAVAWGCAVASPFGRVGPAHTMDTFEDEGLVWRVSRKSSFGSSRFLISAFRDVGPCIPFAPPRSSDWTRLVEPLPQKPLYPHAEYQDVLRGLHPAVEFLQPPSAVRARSVAQCETQITGWPIHAMAVSAELTFAIQRPRTPGLPAQIIFKTVPQGSASGWLVRGNALPDGCLLLPLRPLWPGFALSALGHALIWWAAFTSVVALHRTSRLRRGLCSRCGYDLRHAVHDACPECGGVAQGFAARRAAPPVMQE